MKLSIPRKPARAAAFAAITARVFIHLAVDTSGPPGGVWISALLGAALSVPWLLGLWALEKGGAPARRDRQPLLRVALLAALLPDAARTLVAAARSADYLTPNRVGPLALLLPACLAALWCASRGGSAVGYGAMIWVRLAPALMLPVVLLQLGRYHPAWLFPLLGPGWPGIISAGARCAGLIMALTGVLLAAEERRDGESPAPMLRMLAFAAGSIALLVALRLMMTPTMLKGGESWLERLDSLLVNGRAPLYLQLPMIALWFGGLMHLLACEVFAAAAALQRLFPGLDGRMCALLVTASAALLFPVAASHARALDALARWCAVALPLCAALALATPMGKEA